MTIEELKKSGNVAAGYQLDAPQDREEYLKTAVAFANGAGGRLVFGVKNQTWDVVGFPDDEVFQKYDAIANSIYDACTPSLVPILEIEEIDGKKIIVANILSGMEKPYYLRAYGMMEGTYIRLAGVTRKAEPYMIRELHLQGTNQSFDTTQVPGEEILTDEIDALCERMYQHALFLCKNDEQRRTQKKVTASQLVQWRILVRFHDKFYPSCAWKLLTGDTDDLFPDTFIQMALFKGKTRAMFLDRKEARGPIDQQIEDAVAFVKKRINLGSRIEGVYREDIFELPMDSVRELISNAVCHRSYLSPGSIQVAIYDDRLEVTSPGRLSPDLTIAQMIEGNSRVRNIAIGAAFQYMHIIEKWGSGIPRVVEDTRLYGLGEPEIRDFGTSFRVSICRRPFETDVFGAVIPRKDAEHTDKHQGFVPNGVEHGAEEMSSTPFGVEHGAEVMNSTPNGVEHGAEEMNSTPNEAEHSNEETSSASPDDPNAVPESLLALLPEKDRSRAGRIIKRMLCDPHSTIVQIAKEIGSSKNTVQRAIDGLKRAGIVSRKGSNNGGKWVIHW